VLLRNQGIIHNGVVIQNYETHTETPPLLYVRGWFSFRLCLERPVYTLLSFPNLSTFPLWLWNLNAVWVWQKCKT